MKHAFTASQDAEVTVSLRGNGEHVRLEVRDNGRGLPENLDLAQAKSLGLRIVQILARRLAADVQVENAGGTAFRITFPLHADPPCEPRRDSPGSLDRT
jgi:two-component sensor histidine kinase